MDQCPHCRKHHNPYEICDAYIENIKTKEPKMSEDKKPREPYWAVKRYPDVERRTIQIFRNDEFVSCIESTTASDDFVNMVLRDYAELQSKYEALKEESARLKSLLSTLPKPRKGDWD